MQWCCVNIFFTGTLKLKSVQKPVLVFVPVWFECQSGRRKKRSGLQFAVQKNKPVRSGLGLDQTLVYNNAHKNSSKNRKKQHFFSIRQPILSIRNLF